MDSSTRLTARLLEIPGFCDQESEVAKRQQAALPELIEWIRKVEPESAEDLEPNETPAKRKIIDCDKGAAVPGRRRCW